MLFAKCAILASLARVRLAEGSGGLAPARAAEAVFAFLETELRPLDTRHFTPDREAWDYPPALDWGRPWLMKWQRFNALCRRHVFRGLLRELSVRFGEAELVAAFEEGKVRGFDAAVSEYLEG